MNEALALQCNLAFLEKEANERAAENERFRSFIMHQHVNIDPYVQELNLAIAPAIDCTSCGNCCRSLMINVSREEVDQLAEREHSSSAAIISRYMEESTGGQLVINTIPCHFLEENKCSIYEDRFADCRAFPHLDREGFAKRMFGILMHYGRCPIIYNVIEQLKIRTNFDTHAPA